MPTKSKIDKTVQQKMKQALDAYKKDKNSAKEFYPCMQEMTQWLKAKEK